MTHPHTINYDLLPRPTTTPRLTPQVPPQHRQHAYLRRLLQRSKDLPWKGALYRPPQRLARRRYSAVAPPHTIYVWPRDCDRAIEGIDADGNNRASCTSVVTARSSASRTARPSPSSCRGRTPARSHGPPSTDGCTRRVSLRLVCLQLHMRLGDGNGCAPSYVISRVARCVQMAMSAAPIAS